MNLTPVAFLAFAAVVEGRLSDPHALAGAEQLSFLAEPCADRGCAPNYCYPMYSPEDKQCYKSGYPKCCTKNKGNCPNNSKPDCECLPGVCSDNTSTRRDRCTPGDGTCKGDNFCKVAEDTCGTEGRCEVMPAQCDRTLKQVCGCNGATYDNECLAFAHGVSVDYSGACGRRPESNDCTLDGPSSQCAYNEFCAADEGQCLLRKAGVPGKCQPLRDTCNYSYNPVCGCDRKTYDNADCAEAAGVNVAREGACDSNDRNVDRTSCIYYNVNDDNCSANNAFCKIEDGDCTSRVGRQSGLCGIKPKRCSRDYRPVCGCDSKTYDNECEARIGGVNVMYNGKC